MITIQFHWRGIWIIIIFIMWPYSSSQLHIEAWLGQMCKSLSRIYCIEGLWATGREARTIVRIDPLSLLDALGTEMCMALKPTSTDKSSSTKSWSDGSSHFSSTGWMQVELGGCFDNSVSLIGTPSPFLSYGRLNLILGGYFGCLVSLNFFIFIFYCNGLAIFLSSWNHFNLLSLSIFWI